jgi:polyisoprenoid-binding protein YceI
MLTAALALPAAAAEFTIDIAHSSVNFKVAHMVISKVRGSFQTFEGTINLDQEDIAKSSVHVTIEVASIDTANEKRDEHLRSADFFDAANHPQITFKSTSVRKSAEGYVATGDLSIRGTTHRVELPFTIKGPITDPWGSRRVGFEIDPIMIDRREFGLSWSQALETGGLIVGDEVDIELEVEAIEVAKADDA